MKMKLTSFEKGFIAYLFFGILVIDIFQYLIFQFLSPFPSADLIYILKISWIEDLPNYGYILSLLPAFIGLIIAMMGILVRNIVLKLVFVSSGTLIAMLISASFVPIGVPLVLGYLVLIGSLGLNVVIRSQAFAGKDDLFLKKVRYNPKTQKVVLESFRLVHDRWATMLREIIGFVLSVALIAASVIFVYFSSGASVFLESTKSRVFFEIQTVFIGTILLYSLFGVFAGGVWFCYTKLLDIESQLQRYHKKMIQELTNHIQIL